MKRLGTVTYRPDGIAVLEREGAEDVVVETTPAELPAVLLETYGAGARLASGIGSARGPARADVILPPAVTSTAAIPRPAPVPDWERETAAWHGAVLWYERSQLPTARPGAAR